MRMSMQHRSATCVCRAACCDGARTAGSASLRRLGCDCSTADDVDGNAARDASGESSSSSTLCGPAAATPSEGVRALHAAFHVQHATRRAPPQHRMQRAEHRHNIACNAPSTATTSHATRRAPPQHRMQRAEHRRNIACSGARDVRAECGVRQRRVPCALSAAALGPAAALPRKVNRGMQRARVNGARRALGAYSRVPTRVRACVRACGRQPRVARTLHVRACMLHDGR
jgi:hypothetical protein